MDQEQSFPAMEESKSKTASYSAPTRAFPLMDISGNRSNTINDSLHSNKPSNDSHLAPPKLTYSRAPSNPELHRRSQSIHTKPYRPQAVSLSHRHSVDPARKPLQIDISNQNIYLPKSRLNGSTTLNIDDFKTKNTSFVAVNQQENQPERVASNGNTVKVPVLTPRRIISPHKQEIGTSMRARDGSSDEARHRRLTADTNSARMQDVPEEEFQRLMRGIRRRARRAKVQLLPIEHLASKVIPRSMRGDSTVRITSPNKDFVSSQPMWMTAPMLMGLAPTMTTLSDVDEEAGGVFEDVALHETASTTPSRWYFLFCC